MVGGTASSGVAGGTGPRSLRSTTYMSKDRRHYIRILTAFSTVLTVTAMVMSAGVDMRSASSYAGTGSNDTFVGTRQADSVNLRGGRDRATGKGGPDTLVGGGGQDELLGGGSGDLLKGGDGDDQVWPGRGADTVRLGPGNDEVTLAPDGRIDTIDCGPGHDTVVWLEAADPLDALINCEDVLTWTTWD